MSTFIIREPRAQAVDFGVDTLIVHLEDGRSISAPLEWFPRLRDASDSDRRRWRLIGRGGGIHWETLTRTSPCEVCWKEQRPLPDFDARWKDSERREELLKVARLLEEETSIVGASAHLLAVGTKA